MSTVTPMAAETAARLRDAPLTYAAVGQTAGELPAGYRHIRRSAVIGFGQAVFTAAATALLTWQAHLRAGLQVCASTAAAGLRTARCSAIRKPARKPSSSAGVTTARVTFTITGFSQPATPLATMTAPLGRAIQDRITTRYLRALAS